MSSTVLAAPPALDWPLVGRDGELRLLIELLRRPGARGVVLAGPPGTGRTRLGLEWLDAAEQSGLPTARIVATRAHKDIPYAAVAPLAPEPADGSEAAGDGIEARLTAAMTRLADGGRVAVVIDDVQFLDVASARFVHQLVTSGLGLVVAALRTREATPEAVTALWKEGLLDRVDLVELDGEQVEQLLSAALGGPVDRSLVVRLTARCRGNLVFLRELVLAAIEAGALVRDEGIWRLHGLLTPSERLVELVETRLAGLDDDQRLVLAALAAGEVLGAALLTAVGDLGVIERLEAGCHIVGTVSGRRLEFRLTHPVQGIVIQARISVLRYRRLLATLVAAVEATGARRADDVLTLARWRVDIGGASPGLLVAGAARATRHHDFVLAERLARSAIAAGGGFAAHLAVIRAISLQGGRSHQAEAELEALDAGSDDERLQVTLFRVEHLARMGRDIEALELADTSLTAPRTQAELEAVRVGLLLSTAGPESAAAAAKALRERCLGRPPEGVALVEALALSRRGLLAAATVACGEAAKVHIGPEGPHEATAVQTWWLAGGHQMAQAEAMAAAGRLADAQALAGPRYDAATIDTSVVEQAWAAIELATVLLLQGRVASATRHASEASSLFRQLRRPSPLRHALIPLALSLALRGRPEEASGVLADIDDLGLPPSAWTSVEHLRARAWTAAAAGDLAGGRQLLDEAAEAGQAVGDLLGVSAALHDLARLGAAKRVSEALTELAEGFEGDLVVTRAAHATALAAGDAAGLQAVSITFEAIGDLLVAAEAAADAAVVVRRDGQVRAATAHQRRSSALAERCEGVITPALGPVETRALLTPAERETALMAAGGGSNKEIADALFLSVRTVENRLMRVYEKLGIPGRSSLAVALEA